MMSFGQINDYCQDHFDTAKLRELIKQKFSDDEILTICFDHFRNTYEKFSTGMTRTIKIHLLIEDCYRHNEMDQLLKVLSEYNSTFDGHKAQIRERNKKPSAISKTSTVNILISNIKLDELTTVQREGLSIGFKVALASVLNIPVDDVRVLDMIPGSVQLTISLPSTVLKELATLDSLFVSEELGIQKITFENSSQTYSPKTSVPNKSHRSTSVGSTSIGSVGSTGAGYAMIARIEKAKMYGIERERLKFDSFTVRLAGDNDMVHIVSYDHGDWDCDCYFFASRGRCSHTMAVERVLEDMFD